MLPAYISHPDYALHEMGADHPECPARLGAVKDQLLVTGLLNFMQPFDAPLVSDEQLTRAHTPAFIASLHQLAPTEGYVSLDADTRMNSHSLPAALRAAGAAVLATDLIMRGQARLAFCNVRPPGHHAGPDRAGGFCLFNNVAVGIRHAQQQHGLERIALIDFDVHHGDGSEDIFCDDPSVLMCSSFEIGNYPLSGTKPKGPNMINIGLPARTDGNAMRTLVEQHWLPALHAFKPQMIFISAGFDAHREDELGNLGWLEVDYEWVTKQIVQIADLYASGRIVSCLEGGYSLSALGRSAAAHVKALIGAAAE